MAGYIGTQAVSVNTTSATISDDLAVGDDLTVTDDATIGGTLAVADGSASAPSITNTGDVDTGIFFQAANTVSFSTNGTLRARINDAHLGIETDGAYFQLAGSSNNFWALGSTGGNNAPGTASTTLAFHHYNGSAWNNEVEFDASGNITLDGNLKVAAGKGIDFAAQTATSASGASTGSEILDHYEEGTWTPTIVTGGINISANVKNTYTRIGNQVYIQMYLSTGNSSGNTATFIIGGLPFTLPSNSYNVGSVDIGKSAHVGIYPRTKVSTTNLEFFFSAGNVSTDRTVVLGNDIGASSYIILSIAYLIN